MGCPRVDAPTEDHRFRRPIMPPLRLRRRYADIQGIGEAHYRRHEHPPNPRSSRLETAKQLHAGQDPVPQLQEEVLRLMYGKHYASMYSGSMIGAGPVVFAVWGYAIANAIDGDVELNPKLLGLLLGCSEAEVRTSIEYLCAPDPDSRSKLEDGRRMLPRGSFAYFVVNHSAYRGLANEKERRAYYAEAQRKHREKARQTATSTDVNAGSPADRRRLRRGRRPGRAIHGLDRERPAAGRAAGASDGTSGEGDAPAPRRAPHRLDPRDPEAEEQYRRRAGFGAEEGSVSGGVESDMQDLVAEILAIDLPVRLRLAADLLDAKYGDVAEAIVNSVVDDLRSERLLGRRAR